jgi:hypothetical protein
MQSPLTATSSLLPSTSSRHSTLSRTQDSIRQRIRSSVNFSSAFAHQSLSLQETGSQDLSNLATDFESLVDSAAPAAAGAQWCLPNEAVATAELASLVQGAAATSSLPGNLEDDNDHPESDRGYDASDGNDSDDGVIAGNLPPPHGTGPLGTVDDDDDGVEPGFHVSPTPARLGSPNADEDSLSSLSEDSSTSSEDGSSLSESGESDSDASEDEEIVGLGTRDGSDDDVGDEEDEDDHGDGTRWAGSYCWRRTRQQRGDRTLCERGACSPRRSPALPTGRGDSLGPVIC